METKPPDDPNKWIFTVIAVVVIFFFFVAAYATDLFQPHLTKLEPLKGGQLPIDSVEDFGAAAPSSTPQQPAGDPPYPPGAPAEFHVPLGPPPPGDWEIVEKSPSEAALQGFYLDTYHYIGSDGKTSQLTAEGTPILNDGARKLSLKEWVVHVEAFFENENDFAMKTCLDKLREVGPGGRGPGNDQLGIFGYGRYTLFREKGQKNISRLDIRFKALMRCDWMPPPETPPPEMEPQVAEIKPLIGEVKPASAAPAPVAGGYAMNEQGFYLYLPDTFEFEGNTIVMKANGTPVLEGRTLTTSPNSWTIPLKVTFLDKGDQGTEKCFGKIEDIRSGAAGDKMHDRQLAVFGPGSYTLNKDTRDEHEYTDAVLKLSRVTYCEWMPLLEPPPHTRPEGMPPSPTEEMDREMMKNFLPDPVSPNLRFMDGTPVPPLVHPPTDAP